MPISRVPNFDHTSANPHRCYALGQPKGEGDSGVFRLGNIDMERGWLDISEGAVRTMAQMLGWIAPEQADKQTAEITELKKTVRHLEGQVQLSQLDTVVELSTKLDSERRKTRRYKDRIEQLEAKTKETKERAGA